MYHTRLPLLLAILALSPLAASASGTFYTTESSFLDVLQPGYYLEDFSGFTVGSPLDGGQLSWIAPGANGFGWTASAAENLSSNVNSLSTRVSEDPITITFTGSPVFAFGGDVANSDKTSDVIAGNVTITTSDGGSYTLIIPTATESFLGYTSTVPITSITVSSISSEFLNYAQIGHFYTGAAVPVPEPATTGLMMLGSCLGLAALRRFRRT